MSNQVSPTDMEFADYADEVATTAETVYKRYRQADHPKLGNIVNKIVRNNKMVVNYGYMLTTLQHSPKNPDDPRYSPAWSSYVDFTDGPSWANTVSEMAFVSFFGDVYEVSKEMINNADPDTKNPTLTSGPQTSDDPVGNNEPTQDNPENQESEDNSFNDNSSGTALQPVNPQPATKTQGSSRNMDIEFEDPELSTEPAEINHEPETEHPRKLPDVITEWMIDRSATDMQNGDWITYRTQTDQGRRLTLYVESVKDYEWHAILTEPAFHIGAPHAEPITEIRTQTIRGVVEAIARLPDAEEIVA